MWPPRPPSTRVGPSRPRTSWPRWPGTRSATPSGPGSPCFASITPSSCGAGPIFDCSTTWPRASPIRCGVTGWNRGPRAAVEAASTLLERPGTGARTAAHLVVVFYNLVRLGRLDQATELLSPSAGSAAIPAVDEPWDQWALFGHRAGALIHAGRLREAEELLTGAYDLVLDQPASQARAFVARWLAVLHLEQGRPMSAFRRASESYTLFRQLGQPYPARWPYGFAAL